MGLRMLGAQESNSKSPGNSEESTSGSGTAQRRELYYPHMDKEVLGTDDGDIERTKHCSFDPLKQIKDLLDLGHLLSLRMRKALLYIPPTK